MKDHWNAVCGLEVVLGNGTRLRTGDGALPGSKAWHISKYSIGPKLDGLFMQSSFGIILLAIVEQRPRVLNLLEACELFLDFRRGVVRRRTAADTIRTERLADHGNH